MINYKFSDYGSRTIRRLTGWAIYDAMVLEDCCSIIGNAVGIREGPSVPMSRQVAHAWVLLQDLARDAAIPNLQTTQVPANETPCARFLIEVPISQPGSKPRHPHVYKVPPDISPISPRAQQLEFETDCFGAHSGAVNNFSEWLHTELLWSITSFDYFTLRSVTFVINAW